MELFTRNVNSAFRELVGLFARKGQFTGQDSLSMRGLYRDIPIVAESSRNGNVLRIEEPVTIFYSHPRERVLFNAARDANPFALLYEALWMLAGRNDLTPLTYYTKQFAEYSDDGTTLNGAYGWRWRHHITEKERDRGPVVDPEEWVDQLDILVAHLKAQPDSRRAVLAMWNVENDLLKIGGPVRCDFGNCLGRGWQYTTAAEGKKRLDAYQDSEGNWKLPCHRCGGKGVLPGVNGSKDVCCLAAEVKFRSPEGDVSISELAGRFQTQQGYKFPVYAVDTTTGDQRLCWMTNAWRTGIRPVKRVVFDDGSSVRMTTDHKVFRKKKLFEGKRCVGVNIEEVCVGDLSVGDHLLATLSENSHCRLSPGGYRYFKRNVFQNTNRRNMILEHREYVSLFETLVDYREGKSIHHRNGVKTDNRIENLVQLDNSEHFRIGKEGQDNPHCHMSPEQKAARGQKHSASIRKRFAAMTPEERSQEKLDAIARRTVEEQLRVKENRSAGAKRMYEDMPPEVRSVIATSKIDRTEEQWEILRAWQSSRSNHKIVAIEDGGYAPVYDFTVPGRHNAVLSNGILVHNCNLNVMFSLRRRWPKVDLPGEDTFLDMTVTNRSNDLVWGLLGANYVCFSFLQEYMAARLGVEVGRYTHFTNNLHAYDWNFKPKEWLGDIGIGGIRDPYTETPGALWGKEGRPIPLVSNVETFEAEVREFVEQFSGKQQVEDLADHWDEPFLRDVAQPMMVAWACHKVKDYHGAFACCAGIEAPDWGIACESWMRRRAERHERKGTKA